MNCMQSAEEAYKERVEKAEYSFVAEKINRAIKNYMSWDSFANEVKIIISNEVKRISSKLDGEKLSREWMKSIWLDNMDLNKFFGDVYEGTMKDRLNKFLSDEDIKHRYYDIFSKAFDTAMDFLEDEKKGLTVDDEEIDDLLRDDEEDESTEKEDN